MASGEGCRTFGGDEVFSVTAFANPARMRSLPPERGRRRDGRGRKVAGVMGAIETSFRLLDELAVAAHG